MEQRFEAHCSSFVHGSPLDLRSLQVRLLRMGSPQYLPLPQSELELHWSASAQNSARQLPLAHWEPLVQPSPLPLRALQLRLPAMGSPQY